MSLDMFRLDGRAAIVTGGSKGLGRAMAVALARAGADVVVVSRDFNEAEEAAKELRSLGRKALAVETDVSQRRQVEEMVERTVSEFGKIDVLINNAGVNIRKPVLELSDEEWQEVLDINLTGPLLCSRACAKQMIPRKSGRIINIASILSVVSIPGRAPYAASKGGVLQLTKTLALEWAEHNITVNAICPGPFDTPMNRSLVKDPDAFKSFVSKVPLGRWGRPEELGGVAVFLASDASSFMTGSAVFVDGGWTAL